ncbi:MAG: fumarate hydratase, partial [Clostridia bacterium]|nr:fumarate hydratase [Clostridia bacterium]
MREITAEQIEYAVAKCCIEANIFLPQDIKDAVNKAYDREEGIAKEILAQLKENYSIAENEQMPVCQDTGMTVVFAEIGQEVHIVGKPFEQAIEDGVRKGYEEGYLRKSVVKDPILRGNTGDNTPPVIHVKIVPGENIRLTVAPKGFGSENM